MTTSLIFPGGVLAPQSPRWEPLDVDDHLCPVYKSLCLVFHRPASFPKTKSLNRCQISMPQKKKKKMNLVFSRVLTTLLGSKLLYKGKVVFLLSVFLSKSF